MMQNRGAERSTRLFLLVVILFFAITLVLYFMKRSELLAFQEELVISKKQATEVEEVLNQKIANLQQAVENAEQNVDKLQTQATKCEDQLLKTDKDFEENVKKATAYEKEKDSLSYQLRQVQDEVENIKVKNSALENDKKILNDKLSATDSALRTCRGSSDCTFKLSQCEASLKDKTNELTSCLQRCPPNQPMDGDDVLNQYGR